MADTDSPDDVDMEEDFMIPLTDFDNNFMPDYAKEKMSDTDNDAEDESEEKENKFDFKPLITRRARRRSLLTGTPLPQLSKLEALSQNAGFAPSQPGFVPSKPIAMAKSPLSPTREDCAYSMSPKVKFNWMRILKKVKSIEDPWLCYNISDLPTEVVTRHRYNPLRKKWVVDDIEVKMEAEPFNHGAMRSCFRLKKLSTFSRSKDWLHASNYVAKRYMEKVDREVYFEDVKLQMDAKLWGEEYSRHNPPKKVDIFQMCVMEFKNRPNAPLYHLEHFIEGQYIKYNSNSGFVEESLRLTPQAFSHFTFERSGHKLIVVDVQGVGDLWTDPQIHTANGEGYGDGNLGTRGMALFFHSHICNCICESLHLSKFDLASSEMKTQVDYIKLQKDSVTRVRGKEQHCYSASPFERADLTGFLMRSRSRTTSMASQTSQASSDEQTSPRTPDMADDMELDEEPVTPDSPVPFRRPQIRLQSESSDGSSTITEEEERIRFQESLNRSHRPSCIAAEISLLNLRNLEQANDSTLGQIHHEIAKYHELGRFAKDDNEIDYEAALYHEEQAANLGVIEAQLTLARLYLGMHREVLANYKIEQNAKNTNKGVIYMELAAEAGDRASMIYMAEAYETGLVFGTEKTQSYDQAAKWYERAIQMTQADVNGDFDATMDYPLYQLQAKLASLYLEGKHGLEKDPNCAGEMYTEAAEGAMEAMKGRLANKYYSLAEEAWAQVDED